LVRTLLFSVVTTEPGIGAEPPVRRGVGRRTFRITRPGDLGFASLVGVPDAVGTTMDKDRIAGAAKQVKGSIKEAIGKVSGDAKTQAEGAAEKAAGKAQNTAGGAKDAVREVADE
jgi:uncharacterized protein YjbJ (UPF0337 family)